MRDLLDSEQDVPKRRAASNSKRRKRIRRSERDMKKVGKKKRRRVSSEEPSDGSAGSSHALPRKKRTLAQTAVAPVARSESSAPEGGNSTALEQVESEHDQ